jgi:hypothetical protein
MYDRHTLGALLERAGFVAIAVNGPHTSRVSGWSGLGLDSDAQGNERKAGSLYMEGSRAPG